MHSPEELRYNSLSFVYLQIFTVEAFDRTILNPEQFVAIPNSIDKQIFYTAGNQENAVDRYKFRPFEFKLKLQDTEREIQGIMFVEMSVFFRRTISVTYRMVIDGKKCSTSSPLSTDELISLAALRIGAEHWNCDKGIPGDENCKTASNINLEIGEIEVQGFHLDSEGNWLNTPAPLPSEGCFEEIQRRYKQFILNSQKKAQQPALKGIRDMNYVYVDVWEDIAHSRDLFKSMTEPEIINHIYSRHRQELIGLMSFYPYEWPYRTDESFDDVCGSNIAIDTDDLILVNQNMCVVFGTYGLRGKDSPTDWQEHLEERDHYHVSWPEYLLILEMVLAKKYTLSVVSDLYIKNTLKVSSLKNTRKLIEENSREGLKVTQIMLQLDAVKYSRYISHKIMFERTTKRLEVEKEIERLNETTEKIDKSLFNISEMRKLRQSALLNIVLGIISAASLFGILFESVELPFLKFLGLDEFAGQVGIMIITFTLLLIFFCAIGMIIFSFRNNNIKK